MTSRAANQRRAVLVHGVARRVIACRLGLWIGCLLALSSSAQARSFRRLQLPNGAVFAIEHAQPGHRIMVNRTLGSLIAGSMGRVCLRTGGSEPRILPVAGAEVTCPVEGSISVSGMGCSVACH